MLVYQENNQHLHHYLMPNVKVFIIINMIDMIIQIPIIEMIGTLETIGIIPTSTMNTIHQRIGIIEMIGMTIGTIGIIHISMNAAIHQVIHTKISQIIVHQTLQTTQKVVIILVIIIIITTMIS